MRSVLAALLLCVVFVAGCSGKDKDKLPDVVPPQLSSVLDCTIAADDGWEEPCLALASSNDSPSKAEIDIAVNPKDPKNVFVASKDLDPLASPCVWAVGQVTKDGGKTWKTVYVGGPLAERNPTNVLYGWRCITDPILQFDPNGVLHYSLQAYDWEPLVETPPLGLPAEPEGGFMFQAISHDGGETFDQIMLMHVGDEAVIFHDYMRMGHNPATGTVFTIWNQITGLVSSYPVMVAVQDGLPIPRPPVYFPTLEQPTGLGESSIVGANDGTVYAVLGGFNSPGVVYWARSDDDGLTFTMPEEVFTFTAMGELENAQYRSGTSVEVTVDNSGGQHDGCLYAAWADGSDDVGDILSRTSCDKGTTWSDPVRIHARSAGAQFFPRPSVDGLGRVWVLYYTRAYDPEHKLLDAEVAWSDDGGESWDNQRLTTKSFDGDLGVHQNGFPFIGDYIGLSSSGKDTYAGFSTTVTGRAEIAVAHLVNEKAVPLCVQAEPSGPGQGPLVCPPEE